MTTEHDLPPLPPALKENRMDREAWIKEAMRLARRAVYFACKNDWNEDAERELGRLGDHLRTSMEGEPVATGTAHVTDDEVIELAQAFEQLRAVKIAEAVAAMEVGGKDAAIPTPFQSGFQTACDEILHRLKTEQWDSMCLAPVQAHQQKG